MNIERHRDGSSRAAAQTPRMGIEGKIHYDRVMIFESPQCRRRASHSLSLENQ